MKFRFTIVIGLLYITHVYSQNLNQTIRGNVIDKDSKVPLFSANIILLNSDPFKGTVSNMDGEFRLENVPVGRHDIKVSYLGYKDVIIPELVVGSSKQVVLTIEMEESVVKELEATVSVKKKKDRPINEMAIVSARTFSPEESNRYAGSWGDPARMASNFAGVASGNDMRNDIIVRGNSSIGILWRLDGMEIPNPNHFSTSGATGGGISMLNNNLLANSDFMTGAFPAEYGNTTSGVFDLKMRKGNNEKREHIFQIGANGFELGTEGPFKKEKRNSYLINYRYSTLGVLGAIGALDFIGSVPDYQDLSFKLHFPLKKGYFSMFGLGGKSIIHFDAKKDSLSWKENGDDQYQESAGSNTGLVGLSYMHFVNDKTYIRTSWMSSFVGSFYYEDVLNKDYIFLPEFDTRFDEGKHSLSILANRKFNSRNTLRAGVILNNLFIDIKTVNYDYGVNLTNQQKHTIVDFDGSSYLLQSFTQLKHKFYKNITFNAGAHYLYYFLNDRQHIEPRASIQYQFTTTQSVSLGYGMHSKLLPAGVYFGEVKKPDGTIHTPNKDLDFYRSDHYVFAYDFSISENLRLKLESYFQNIYQVPVLKDTTNSFSGINMGSDFENIVSAVALSSNGTGENYGVELTLEKFFSEGYYFLLTGSLFESTYKGSDGIKRNTVFNSNYATNFLAGKEFKVGKNKNNIISINTTIVNIGGKRTTPIDTTASRIEQRTVRIDSLAFSKKLKDYFRLDIKIGFKLNRKRASHEIAFEAKNVLNEQNIFLQYYSTTTNKIVTEYQMGLFPIMVYRIEF